MSVKQGERHILDITKLVFQGWGLGKLDGFVIFVPNTLPGDTAEIRILKKKSDHAIALKEKILKESPFRNPSLCSHFPECGGCQMIDVSYTDQLKLKTSLLEDACFTFFPELLPKLSPILPCSSHTFYRNKMEFAFGKNEQGIYLGLKKRGEYSHVVPVRECHLLSRDSNKLLPWVSEFFQKLPITVWDSQSCSGTLSHLVIRHSKTWDTYHINLVSSGDGLNDCGRVFAESLMRHFPKVTGVMISNKKSMLSYGTPFLEEKIGEFTFRISPESFFQTNTAQARVLYEKISEMVDLSSSDTLLDLYCGTGSIGLFLSKKVNRIVGIEENSQAIENANENAKINSIPNASFLCGSVQNMLKTFTIKPDVVILDPPRSGMVPKAIVRLLDLKAPRMVYVSCNPATLFRDLKDIAAGGYHIEAIQPVDMFPNTFHIELIIKLKLQKNFQ